MRESVREINKRYCGEWIVVVNTSKDENGNLTEGEVVLHSLNKDEAFRYLDNCRYPKSSATIRYGGHITEGFVVEM